MTRENVMSTPIFDQLLREMAQRTEPGPPPTEPETRSAPPEQTPTPRRRHRAE
ncbi:hypothetical protein [Actinophytocola sp.]|uniref:hypothetical protein n=1 Tax=Actinophytocola sp. TaxID=1872138 RepID=UPI003D6BDEFA